MSSKLILSSDDADSVNVTVELFLDLIQTVLNRSPTPTDLWACLQTLTLPILGDTPLCPLWNSEKPTLDVKVPSWIWQVGTIFGMIEIDHSCGTGGLLYGDSRVYQNGPYICKYQKQYDY